MPTSTEIMIAAPPVDAPFDPRELFAPGVPVEMEIGCGKGGFLLRRAQAFPHRAFLAVEWANKYYKFAADRMARWNISNVRIMRTDASHLVIHQLASNSLAALHLYHPDPWPKKRHHKRRLVQTRFADAVARCLVPDGLWWIQTDHAEYYEWIRAVLDPHPAFVEVKFETESGDALDPATNYQIKYVDQGREIHRAAYQRRPVPEAQKAGVGDAALRPPHSAFEEPTS